MTNNTRTRMIAQKTQGENLYQLSQQAIRAGRRWIEGDAVEVWGSATGDRRAVVVARGRWLYLGLMVGEYQVTDRLTVGALDEGLVVGLVLSGYVEYKNWTERVRELVREIRQ